MGSKITSCKNEHPAIFIMCIQLMIFVALPTTRKPNTILELKTGFHYPGSEVPKPNPGAPKQSSISSLCLLGFLCRGTSDSGYVFIRS